MIIGTWVKKNLLSGQGIGLTELEYKNLYPNSTPAFRSDLDSSDEESEWSN